MQEKPQGDSSPRLYPLNPYLFRVYVQANAVAPQMSDGIKWLVHEAYLREPVVDIGEFAFSEFSPEQLDELRTKANAIHRANNIPFFAPVEDMPAPSDSTPIKDDDFQILMTRVRHSLVNNLYHYMRFMCGQSGEGYQNDLAHDMQVSTEEMIVGAREFLLSGHVGEYHAPLELITNTLQTDEGKELLGRYRGEFKHGKRTSSVWRQEGYGAEFAGLVSREIDASDRGTSYILHINNLLVYPAFSDKSV